MTSLKRHVPVFLCLTSALVLWGCDQTSDTTARVQAVSQQGKPEASEPTAAPDAAAPAKQAEATTEKAPAPQEATKLLAADQPAANGHDHAQQQDPGLTPTNVAPPGSKPVPVRPAKPVAPVDPAAFIVKADPAEVDLGEMPTHDSKTGTCHLVNTGDKAITIVSSRASCGCTTLKLQPNTIIEAKGSLDVEVKMNAPAKAGPVAKNLTFTVEGQPDLIV